MTGRPSRFASAGRSRRRSSSTARNRPSGPRLRFHKWFRAPGIRPATGSIGSVSPRNRSGSRASRRGGGGGGAPGGEPRLHLGEIHREGRHRPRDEGRRRSGLVPRCQLAPGRRPCGESAVENSGAVVSEMAERPPQAGREHGRHVVIGHDPRVVPDSEPAESLGEVRGGGQGMASVPPGLRGREILLEVREYGARDVAFAVPGPAPGRVEQVAPDVHDDELRVTGGEAPAQPAGGDDRTERGRHGRGGYVLPERAAPVTGRRTEGPRDVGSGPAARRFSSRAAGGRSGTGTGLRLAAATSHPAPDRSGSSWSATALTPAIVSSTARLRGLRMHDSDPKARWRMPRCAWRDILMPAR